jgi:hypothetical protein
MPCKGKSKALEVPAHTSFTKAKALLAEFHEPSDRDIIQELLKNFPFCDLPDVPKPL